MNEGVRNRIFLYGTLRRGASHDALVHYGGVEFVSDARVRGVLHDFGKYPGLRLGGSEWVNGEVFDVTSAALAALDEWEGIDPANPDAGDYRRRQMIAQRGDGSSEPCWFYEVSIAYSAGRPVISGGDWMARGTAL